MINQRFVFYLKTAIISIMLLVMLSLSAKADMESENINHGRGTSEDPYLVPKAASSIRIDAVLDEEAWKKVLLLEIATEVWPLENRPAPVKTDRSRPALT